MPTVHNARVQLLATALNNLGVAAVVAGVVAPAVNGNFRSFAHIAVWFVFGIGSLVAGQLVLGRLR